MLPFLNPSFNLCFIFLFTIFLLLKRSCFIPWVLLEVNINFALNWMLLFLQTETSTLFSLIFQFSNHRKKSGESKANNSLITRIFQKHCHNRPFYSCLLSCLSFEWKWGLSWPCFDRKLPAVLTLTLSTLRDSHDWRVKSSGVRQSKIYKCHLALIDYYRLLIFITYRHLFQRPGN